MVIAQRRRRPSSAHLLLFSLQFHWFKSVKAVVMACFQSRPPNPGICSILLVCVQDAALNCPEPSQIHMFSAVG